ncbi:MAG: ATP-binding cassette domain-containing protein [Holosporales bacterium]|jgi:ATP-binding cassette subfamily F protein 3|nr:ATP-binding cassette domain-containing protein [Holosporales bacterium]
MIIIRNLHKKFGARIIINDFTYHFSKRANIGIVGPNGAGKTTFLNIITQLEDHDSGSIIIPKDCVLGYLPQSPCENPRSTILEECISGNHTLCQMKNTLHDVLKKMEESYSDEIYDEYERAEKAFADNDGYALEAEAKGILVGLGFETSQFDESPLILSGGWRMRLELAKLLINNPNFLILDEPTNHLDLPSLAWLEQFLKSFQGTLLFVSHDRDFLNNVANQIMHISNGNINMYTGNFDDYLGQREAKAETAKSQKEALKRKQDHLQEFVDKFRYKASKAKQAQSKIKMIERLKQMDDLIDVEDSDQKPNFKIEVERQSGRVVLDMKDCKIGYGDTVLNKNLTLKILRGNKIAIVGANGIGKTTLLRTIIGETPLLAGTMNFGNNLKIGYYAQSQLEVLDPTLNAIDNVLQLAGGITHQQARAVLGCLMMTREIVQKQLKVLSGGEKSKVAIAALLAQKNNFLILDEPTNHLDMASSETLANALEHYEGTVLVVSHNRSFINSLASHILVMDKTKKAELFYAESTSAV